MCEPLRYFRQEEYSRVLNIHNGRLLCQKDCTKILMEHGASYNQANSGAYFYLHHQLNIGKTKKGFQTEYNQILDDFNGTLKSSMVCIRYLEKQGFSYGQAKSAVHKYRKSRGLIGK